MFTYNTFEWDAKLREMTSLKSFDLKRVKAVYEERLLMRKGTAKCIVFQIWKQGHDDKKKKVIQNGKVKEQEGIKEESQIGRTTLEALQQSLRKELGLESFAFEEIKNVKEWQKALKLMPSYL